MVHGRRSTVASASGEIPDCLSSKLFRSNLTLKTWALIRHLSKPINIVPVLKKRWRTQSESVLWRQSWRKDNQTSHCRRWIRKSLRFSSDGWSSLRFRSSDRFTSEAWSSHSTPSRLKRIVKTPWKVDWYRYKERHLVECFFNIIKHFRRVATRYDQVGQVIPSFCIRSRHFQIDSMKYFQTRSIEYFIISI